MENWASGTAAVNEFLLWTRLSSISCKKILKQNRETEEEEEAEKCPKDILSNISFKCPVA